MEESLLRTPLFTEHQRLQAKLVPFAGYAMPVQYPSGIQAEHRAVREAAGLFDVSHMGEFHVEGPEALDLIQGVTVNDASALEIGQAQYSAFCQDDGGVIDDLLVYRTGADRYLLVVNASNRAADWAHLVSHAHGRTVACVDRSDETALLALQGPQAEEVLARVCPLDLASLDYYRCAFGEVAGQSGLIARTGYTGEDGFELYLPTAAAEPVWRILLAEGASAGLVPAGLGARDTLRLEMGYALYGNDLDREHTALESGLGWITKLDKGPFVGREALLGQKAAGIARKLVGIRLTERGFPRAGYPVRGGGQEVGQLTSGTVSPTTGEGIGLAYLQSEWSAPGTEVTLQIRDRELSAVVQRPPFYLSGSIRR
jgi:aminomethyltransferase